MRLLLSCILVQVATWPLVCSAQSNFESELAEQSKKSGLGILATTSTDGTMPVMYFDETWGKIDCCRKFTQTWVVAGARYLITLDSSNSLWRPTEPASWGQNAIIFDLNGIEQRRFPSWIRANYVAVSSDRKMIAFRGNGGLPPGSHPPPTSGLLFGSVDSTSFQQVFSLPAGGRLTPPPDERAETFGWSPDARSLVYSKDEAVYIYDLQQRASRLLAKGRNPLWSPDGSTISYRGPNREAMLVDVNGRNRRNILSGQKIHYALHWSPDSRYLLLSLFTEERGVRWGQLCVYRLKDGALLPISPRGLGDDSQHDWVVTGQRH